MVIHEAKTMGQDVKASAAFTECCQEELPIIVRQKDVLAVISTGEDMVESPGILDSKGPGHTK